MNVCRQVWKSTIWSRSFPHSTSVAVRSLQIISAPWQWLDYVSDQTRIADGLVCTTYERTPRR